MKVLFLDIDGVLSLNSDVSKRFMLEDGTTVPYAWNSEACLILNDILIKTECYIVISSDWRSHYSLPTLRNIFRHNKVYDKNIIGYTPHSKEYKYGSAGLGRSNEINEWLKLNKVKDWCAVDDLNLIGIDRKKFVKTDPNRGLIGEGISEKIIKILNDGEIRQKEI